MKLHFVLFVGPAGCKAGEIKTPALPRRTKSKLLSRVETALELNAGRSPVPGRLRCFIAHQWQQATPVASRLRRFVQGVVQGFSFVVRVASQQH